MKFLHLIAAALALATAGAAAPALAQSTEDIEPQNRALFMALTQPLIDNIGTADTVILFYISFDGDFADPGFDLGVFYLAPGGKSVRVQGTPLGPVVGRLFHAAVMAYSSDPDFRSATLVIDHSKATLTGRNAGNFDADTPFTQRLAKERERVFPGLPLEPYRAPGS